MDYRKRKKVDVVNFPGATSTDILRKIDDATKKKPESIIIRVDTNDVNLLLNVKKIVSKTNRTSPNTSLGFSDIFEKMREI